MKINGLDDQSLSLIFDRLSVESFLRAGRVCSRWNDIRGKCALSRKSLTLLIGADAVKGIKKSDIRKIPHYKLLTNNKKDNETQIALPDVNEVINYPLSNLQINSMFSSFHVNFLSQLFANVQHFLISFPETNENATLNIQLVNDLLVHWSAKLVTLKLYSYNQKLLDSGDITSRAEWTNSRQLLLTINSMASLKVLHLDLGSYVQSDGGLVVDDDTMFMFEFVSRLTEFHFELPNPRLLKHLIDSLNVHGNRTSDIAIPFLLYSDCDRFVPELAHCFSQYGTTIVTGRTLTYLWSNFINLTILQIYFDIEQSTQFTPGTFYRSMASLKQLVYLYIRTFDEATISGILVDPTDLHTLYGKDHINTSVQVLRLFTFDRFHPRIYGQLCLYHFFPKTQVFVLDRLVGRCGKCSFDGLSYERYCLPQILIATGMANICGVIKTNEPNRKWYKEDLIGGGVADLVFADGEEPNRDHGYGYVYGHIGEQNYQGGEQNEGQ